MYMKKSILAACSAALLATACNNGKTATPGSADSTAVDTTVTANTLPATYTGTMPAADAPGLDTRLTVNADSTYELTQTNAGNGETVRQESGIWHMLAHGVMQLVTPSSGELNYYKLKGDTAVVLTDSLGNEPEGETAQFYELKRKQ